MTLVAECLKFADVVELLTFWVGAGVVVASAEVVEVGVVVTSLDPPSGGVGERVGA